MPHVIDLGPEPPIGFCVEAARNGQQVCVQTSGTAYPEDGTKLVKWLDDLVTPVLAKLKPAGIPSVVDHLLAVVQPNGSAKVYVNEIHFIGQVRTKGAVVKGAPVYFDDVADFGPLEMKGIDVPKEAGFILVMSSGWRRGVFFDLGPVAGSARAYDLAAALGAFWGYLAFGDRVRLTDEQWTALLANGWFPFVGLKLADLHALLGHIDSGWNPDEVLPQIADSLKGRCERLLTHANEVPVMAEHLEVFAAAVRHYLAGDNLSACSLLYPRIEGILRGHAGQVSESPNLSQKGLTAAVSIDVSGRRLPGSLLLPDRFREYIEKIYFAPFDPASVDAISRNSVSHGIAPAAKLDLKAATVALLVVEQLLYVSGKEKKKTDATITAQVAKGDEARRARNERKRQRKRG
jgi:hypothetical protein